MILFLDTEDLRHDGRVARFTDAYGVQSTRAGEAMP